MMYTFNILIIYQLHLSKAKKRKFSPRFFIHKELMVVITKSSELTYKMKKGLLVLVYSKSFLPGL